MILIWACEPSRMPGVTHGHKKDQAGMTAGRVAALERSTRSAVDEGCHCEGLASGQTTLPANCSG
jgi:hypothetical protein